MSPDTVGPEASDIGSIFDPGAYGEALGLRIDLDRLKYRVGTLFILTIKLLINNSIYD